MSGTSSVGNRNVYEAGDQRTEPASKPGGSFGEEGTKNSHQANDSKDERSIANRLATAEPQNDGTSGKALDAEAKAGQTDATAPAKMHGNEPSRGAQIDKELQDEEAAILAKKDAAKGSKKPGGTGDVSGKKN
ncbi:hypothetical protein G647_07119 [Cladophialophora carrionii CBS 160.54]|uniref:Uncharacterized protein n=1 Tax=Cladophialophora carrionii CBS 160.54 TaxID=1279043 RepID=V9D451_9EURO|nr:uncharacterized protein G647_07119 [Cladophialophora carrionii CBS 160.54]ETI20777.1 hypothetical protein G647_07119 [Cladophialophora carrionii CBS 160.54]